MVWLTASDETIWERVSRNKKRPLLHTENPSETVRALLEERNPLYEAVAEMKVDTSRIDASGGGGEDLRAGAERGVKLRIADLGLRIEKVPPSAVVVRGSGVLP